MQYYEINEQTARRANDVNSMSDYRPGSATEEYRAAVDKAAALVQARKAKISPYYHDKLDALLDRYARRLADYYNAYYRNESACPSILVCGGSNFPVRKKQMIFKGANPASTSNPSLITTYGAPPAVLRTTVCM